MLEVSKDLLICELRMTIKEVAQYNAEPVKLFLSALEHKHPILEWLAYGCVFNRHRLPLWPFSSFCTAALFGVQVQTAMGLRLLGLTREAVRWTSPR